MRIKSDIMQTSNELIQSLSKSTDKEFVEGTIERVAKAQPFSPEEIAIADESEDSYISAHWVYKDIDHFRKYSVMCSNCKELYYGDYDQAAEPEEFNFCPNCGARITCIIDEKNIKENAKESTEDSHEEHSEELKEAKDQYQTKINLVMDSVLQGLSKGDEDRWEIACELAAEDGECEGCTGIYTEWCSRHKTKCKYYYYYLASKETSQEELTNE